MSLTLQQENERLRDRIEELEELFGQDDGLTFAMPLSPMPSKTLGLLLKRTLVSRDAAMTVLYGGRPDDQWPCPKIIDVHITRVRCALRVLEIELNTSWNVGWFLTPDQKAKVQDYIAAFARGEHSDLVARIRHDVADLMGQVSTPRNISLRVRRRPR